LATIVNEALVGAETLPASRPDLDRGRAIIRVNGTTRPANPAPLEN